MYIAAKRVVLSSLACISALLFYLSRSHLTPFTTLPRVFMMNALTVDGVIIKSYYNVCVEESEPVTRILEDGIEYTETRRLVAYGASVGIEDIRVAGSMNTPWNHWTLHHVNATVPHGRNVLPAGFFLTPTCPANLHHFWEDSFAGLYSVVRAARRLRRGLNNSLLYRRPLHVQNPLRPSVLRECTDTKRYEELLRTLNVVSHDVFYHTPNNTCFSLSVFGVTTALAPNPRDAGDHVLKFLRVQRDTNVSSRYVTILQRRQRRIANADELRQALIDAGHPRVQVVAFGDFGVRYQLRIAANSRVLIGVQGAGLQHSMFMAPGSLLIEIWWPHWETYYQNTAKMYSLRYAALAAEHVTPNWTSYAVREPGEKTLNDNEKEALVKYAPSDNHVKNIWKWADGTVNSRALVKLVQRL